jgi:predicted secreted protein
MAKFNGSNVVIYCDGVKVAHSIDGTITFNEDHPDATTKDSSRWKEHIHGDRGWEVSVNGLMDFSASMNGVELADFILNSNDVSIKVSNGTAGDIEWRGQVSLDSTSLSFPHNAPAAFDGTFTGNGAPTKVTIT